ncbi:MAG TPA: DcaP family trimeric outer membrane transporter, partial [Methylomirabilota bacterium]|nr:DcaP family trimeric outer membrane transporter [Methylomirabilota bacterium]
AATAKTVSNDASGAQADVQQGQDAGAPLKGEAANPPSKAEPEEPAAPQPGFVIYGAAMLDYIQDFNRVDPNWAATLRPSKIPTTPGEFGGNGQSILSVRQSKFGVTAEQVIAGQPLFVKFEFDLFGSGANEGETTFHLQHAYGTWGPILVGKTDSTFMDGSIFPDVIDYWGPPGMPYLRNPQLRLTYKAGPHELAGAIEEPSNDVDPGQLRLVDPALGAVQGVEHIPDFTGHYRYDAGWGHIQIGGILRQVSYETVGAVDSRPKGSKLGWGVNLTSNLKVTKSDVLHLGAVYGEGIASYMNDGGTDLAPGVQVFANPALAPPGAVLVPQAEAEPLLGVVAYLDHAWNSQFSSSIGYSITQVQNSVLQEPTAFRSGQYATVNLIWRPDSHILFGAEYEWGQREDHDGASGSDNRVQFSAKYSFSSKDFFR